MSKRSKRCANRGSHSDFNQDNSPFEFLMRVCEGPAGAVEFGDIAGNLGSTDNRVRRVADCRDRKPC